MVVKDLAEKLNIKPATVYQWIKVKKVKSRTVKGIKKVVVDESIENLLKQVLKEESFNDDSIENTIEQSTIDSMKIDHEKEQLKIDLSTALARIEEKEKMISVLTDQIDMLKDQLNQKDKQLDQGQQIQAFMTKAIETKEKQGFWSRFRKGTMNDN